MKLSLNYLFIPLLILHTHKKLNGQGVERTYFFFKNAYQKKKFKEDGDRPRRQTR